MAAKGLGSLTFRLFSCTSTELHNSKLRCIGILACYQQVRTHKYYSKPRTKLPPWQIKVREEEVEENLTEENEEFLKRMADKSYRGPLKREPWARNKWQPLWTKRAGLVAVNLGHVPQWKKDGSKINCQVLQVLDNHVIKYVPSEIAQTSWVRTPSSQDKGYVVVGANSSYPFEFTKEYCGLFKEAGVPPKKKMFKFFITPNAAVQPGTPLNVMHFKVGQHVDCVARSIDRGFQGAMKRHGFSGLPATHGVTKSHRKMGSTGTGRDHGLPKGKKMPGFMGDKYRYIRGLRIVRINTKYNLIYVHSTGVPGPTHGYVRISDTILPNRRRQWKEDNVMLPMPTAMDEDFEGQEIPENLYADDIFDFTEESIQFEVVES